MGKEFAAAFPSVATLFSRADAILGTPLSATMADGPEEKLTQTRICQPALYVHGIGCLTALREAVPGLEIHAAAGLSLGEFTAHCAAGTFDFETGLKLVAQRGALMQEACEATHGGMAAMIGADENVVRDLAAETDVDVANLNCPGQIVISGEASKVALAVSLAKEHGIRRATVLNVAGAYHSRLMKSAWERLGASLAETPMHQPAFPVICNLDAQPVSGADRIRYTLQEQVTGTVRWTESMEYLLDQLAIERFIELGPGGVLAGLMSRIRKGVEVFSVSDPASLEAAAAVLRG